MPEPCAHEHLGSVRTTLLCGLAGGALSAAIQLPFLGRYGWDRDELYFLSAARRPALGYVDFPPLTAWIGWLVHAVAGSSLVALRLTCLAAGIGVIVLIALMVRELGGGWRAQLAAAVGWALLPVALGSASIFHPTWFDQLAWAAFLYVALRVLGRPEPRLWPVLGLVAGIGLEAKYTIAVLLVAFTIGLLADPVEAPAGDARAVARARGRAARLPAEPRLAGRARVAERPLRLEPELEDRRGHLAGRLSRAGGALPGACRRGDRRRRDRLALAEAAAAAARDRAGRGDVDLPRGARAELLPAARATRSPFAAGIVSVGGWLRAGSRVRWAAVGALVARPARGARGGGAARPAGALDRLDGASRDLEGHLLQGRARLAGARRRDGAGVARAAGRRIGATASCSPRTTARPRRSSTTARRAGCRSSSAATSRGSTGVRSTSTSASRSSSATTPASSARSAARGGRSLHDRQPLAHRQRGAGEDDRRLHPEAPARRALAPVHRPRRALARRRPGRGRRRRCAPSGRGCRAARGGRCRAASAGSTIRWSPIGSRPEHRAQEQQRRPGRPRLRAARGRVLHRDTSSSRAGSRRTPRAAGRRRTRAASRMPAAIRAASSLKP